MEDRGVCVLGPARAVRRVAGRLWNFRHASGFVQERFSNIVIVAIGEFLFFLAQFLNKQSKSGTTFVIHIFGVFIGYSIWWTYFDNINLAVLDNSNHHMVLTWAHLNMCMCVAICVLL